MIANKFIVAHWPAIMIHPCVLLSFSTKEYRAKNYSIYGWGRCGNHICKNECNVIISDSTWFPMEFLELFLYGFTHFVLPKICSKDCHT
jgi:hypothetical protein